MRVHAFIWSRLSREEASGAGVRFQSGFSPPLSLVSDFDGLTCGGVTAVDDSICVLIAQGKNACFAVTR